MFIYDFIIHDLGDRKIKMQCVLGRVFLTHGGKIFAAEDTEGSKSFFVKNTDSGTRFASQFEKIEFQDPNLSCLSQ